MGGQSGPALAVQVAPALTRGIQVTFDASDPHALAAWWSDLLGYKVEDGHEVIEGLLADGVVTEEDVVEVGGRLCFSDAAAASDPKGNGPRLYFQRVPEEKVAKNRVHLDVPVEADALDDEVARVCSLGATFVCYGQHSEFQRWAVLRDPEGNEFCLH